MMTNNRGTSDSAKTIIEQIRDCRHALKVTQLAKMLGMSRQAIYDHIEHGTLPALRIGTSIRLDPKMVADWLEARSTTLSTR
jgi:excisionase family DNA binding protein